MATRLELISGSRRTQVTHLFLTCLRGHGASEPISHGSGSGTADPGFLMRYVPSAFKRPLDSRISCIQPIGDSRLNRIFLAVLVIFGWLGWVEVAQWSPAQYIGSRISGET